MVQNRKEHIFRKDRKPLLSIVVLTWNGLGYLKNTLPKILETQGVDFEVIIFDNGSEDGTDEFVLGLSKSTANTFLVRMLYVVSDQNLGISKGKNKAIQYTAGKYLLILDNDVLIDENTMIKRIVKDYESFRATKENIGLINIPLFDSTSPEKTRQYGVYYGLYGILRNPFVKTTDIMNYPEKFVRQASCFGGDLFTERTTWDSLCGFDESQLFNVDDDDLGSRASILGYRNYVYTKSLFEHTGIANRKNNKQYTWYFSMYYSGKIRPIWKNFSILTAIWMSFCFTAVTFGVAIKQSIIRGYPGIFLALIKSIYTCIRKFPDTLKQRQIIQKKRVISDDEILKIKSPKYDRISTLDINNRAVT